VLVVLILLGSGSIAAAQAPIAKAGWTLHSVSSQETLAEDGRAVNAFDGNPATIWHSRWSNGMASLPHDIEINLGETHPIMGFRYLPRRDGGNGHIGSFEFYVSADGNSWGSPVSSGIFTYSLEEKQAIFTPTNGRFVRLRMRTEARGLSVGAIAELTVIAAGTPPEALPYNNTNPIILHNDDAIDVYTDEYLLALNSAGDIDLRGMITGSSVAPHNDAVTLEYMLNATRQRTHIADLARQSGFARVPLPVSGAFTHLVRPESGLIDDTSPINTDGSRLIVAEALRATPAKPLVVVAGGPLTDVADAYLLNRAVADRIIVAWVGGTLWDMADYNGAIDGWASYIVLEKLRLVQFTAGEFLPHVPKWRLSTLPDTPLRQWMIAKERPNGLPGEQDGDGSSAVSVMKPDFVGGTRRVSFGGWVTRRGYTVPTYRDDADGRALIVTSASAAVATDEWWRALSNPAAYARPGVDSTASPGRSAPAGRPLRR
jgi:hypothetical protein